MPYSRWYLILFSAFIYYFICYFIYYLSPAARGSAVSVIFALVSDLIKVILLFLYFFISLLRSISRLRCVILLFFIVFHISTAWSSICLFCITVSYLFISNTSFSFWLSGEGWQGRRLLHAWHGLFICYFLVTTYLVPIDLFLLYLTLIYFCITVDTTCIYFLVYLTISLYEAG